MYANLQECLKKKGISINAAALVVLMPEPTFRSKLTSRSFSIEEAYAIKDNLFPEADMRYLFEKKETA